MDIKNGMRLLLNGKEVPIRWQHNGEFEATATPDQFVTGTNELKFTSDIDKKYYGFSARLKWVEIKKSDQQ
ncbi:hypothetical protein D3C86_1987720 [compost metagenome]